LLSRQPAGGAMNPVEARSVASFDRESDMLPRDLPPGAVRGLATFLILLSGAFGAFATFVPVPETARCPFVLVPEAGVDAMKSEQRGTIERVLVADGAEVSSGELMFVLRSDDLHALSVERATLERANSAARIRLRELEAEEAARKGSDEA